MAAPTWARARAGPNPACEHAHVQVGAALSTKSAPFYRMARFLGIPRKRIFLKSSEHIYVYIYRTTYGRLVPVGTCEGADGCTLYT